MTPDLASHLLHCLEVSALIAIALFLAAVFVAVRDLAAAVRALIRLQSQAYARMAEEIEADRAKPVAQEQTEGLSWADYSSSIRAAAADAAASVAELRARKHAVDRPQRLDPNSNTLKPADMPRDGGRHADGR